MARVRYYQSTEENWIAKPGERSHHIPRRTRPTRTRTSKGGDGTTNKGLSKVRTAHIPTLLVLRTGCDSGKDRRDIKEHLERSGRVVPRGRRHRTVATARETRSRRCTTPLQPGIVRDCPLSWQDQKDLFNPARIGHRGSLLHVTTSPVR